MFHWDAMIELTVGVALSMLIGLEREFHGKAAGIRTCALVGLGSTLFTVVSRQGEWLLPGMTVTNVDGARVAAQIVSGIGFLGAGLIFVRRDSVRGLTTAASIWLVAAVGMAAGAGVVDLAVTATILYLLVIIGLTPLRSRLPHSSFTHEVVSITYEDGHGVLRDVMNTIGNHGVAVDHLDVLSVPDRDTRVPLQRVRIEMHTIGGSLTQLLRELAEIPRVRGVDSARGTDEDG
ncbi:MgtC/SapB family protein [Propioniciclava flava]|nr:MgtC/SapB family protein [Propioniciclava flava]